MQQQFQTFLKIRWDQKLKLKAHPVFEFTEAEEMQQWEKTWCAGGILTEDKKTVLKENGIEIINILWKMKRPVSRSLSTSSKFCHKDELLQIMKRQKWCL